MTKPRMIFDTALLSRRKDRCASAGGAPAFLLQRAVEDITERLEAVCRSFSDAAVIGALDGSLSRRLSTRAGLKSITSIESSPRFLAGCPAPQLVWDGETLPLEDGSIDLAVSVLALHLVNDLPGLLVQIRRALRPDGLFLAAMLGGETLSELRQAWLAAEAEVTGGASPRVVPFADVRDLGALLQRAGLALPVVDSDRVTVTYTDPTSLMRDIKAMGASNMLSDRSRTPVTRGLLFKAAEVYRQRFALPGGRVPATFEILTLTAWAPDESQQKPLAPGSARMRLADALSRKP